MELGTNKQESVSKINNYPQSVKNTSNNADLPSASNKFMQTSKTCGLVMTGSVNIKTMITDAFEIKKLCDVRLDIGVPQVNHVHILGSVASSEAEYTV